MDDLKNCNGFKHEIVPHVVSDVTLVFQIYSTDTTSVIVIPDCKMHHSGRYILNAESPAGHKVVKVRVTVLGT